MQPEGQQLGVWLAACVSYQGPTQPSGPGPGNQRSSIPSPRTQYKRESAKNLPPSLLPPLGQTQA